MVDGWFMVDWWSIDGWWSFNWEKKKHGRVTQTLRQAEDLSDQMVKLPGCPSRGGSLPRCGNLQTGPGDQKPGAGSKKKSWGTPKNRTIRSSHGLVWNGKDYLTICWATLSVQNHMHIWYMCVPDSSRLWDVKRLGRISVLAGHWPRLGPWKFIDNPLLQCVRVIQMAQLLTRLLECCYLVVSETFTKK